MQNISCCDMKDIVLLGVRKAKDRKLSRKKKDQFSAGERVMLECDHRVVALLWISRLNIVLQKFHGT